MRKTIKILLIVAIILLTMFSLTQSCTAQTHIEVDEEASPGSHQDSTTEFLFDPSYMDGMAPKS
jgi:hypothetical protein